MAYSAAGPRSNRESDGSLAHRTTMPARRKPRTFTLAETTGHQPSASLRTRAVSPSGKNVRYKNTKELSPFASCIASNPKIAMLSCVAASYMIRCALAPGAQGMAMVNTRTAGREGNGVLMCMPPNGSRLSCGRSAGGRKAADPPIQPAGEGTQFFPSERPAASSAC